MPSQEYFAHPGMNQSKLRNILFGAEQFREYCNKPRKPSAEQQLGSAVHLLTFEPHLSDKIMVLPKIDERTNKGKIFALLQEGKEPSYFEIADKKRKKDDENPLYQVSSEDHDYMLSVYEKYQNVFKSPDNYIFLNDNQRYLADCMHKSLMANEDFCERLANCTHYESTHFFHYRGIDFKAQTDARGFFKHIPFILDLKTTSMPPMPQNEEDFRKKMWWQIISDWYHFQAACYLKTIEPDFMGDDRKIYYIFYVRSIAPFQVYPVELSEEMIMLGNTEFDRACDLYLQCLRENPSFKANNRIIRV